MSRIPDRVFVLIGWWLFVICAVFFIISSARSGDVIALLGSIAFMAANIAFLIPFYRRPSRDENED